MIRFLHHSIRIAREAGAYFCSIAAFIIGALMRVALYLFELIPQNPFFSFAHLFVASGYFHATRIMIVVISALQSFAMYVFVQFTCFSLPATIPLPASLPAIATLFLFAWRCEVADSCANFLLPSFGSRAGEVLATLLQCAAPTFIISVATFQVCTSCRSRITDQKFGLRTHQICTGLLGNAAITVCASGAHAFTFEALL
jgi:hypothetical protein